MAGRDSQRYWTICRTCGKRAYVSRKAARRARVKLPDHRLGPLSAYPCPVGTGWHLGHVRDGDRDRQRRMRHPTGEQDMPVPSATCYNMEVSR